MSFFREQRRAMGRWMVRNARRVRDSLWNIPQMPSSENPPSRILIIRPYFLGDILLALPVAQALRKRWPQTHISWLLREEWRELLGDHSAVDDVIPFSQGKMHSSKALAEFVRVTRELRSQKFDLVINLAWDRSSSLWAWSSGALVRVGIEEYGRPRFSSLLHQVTVVAPERTKDLRPMVDFYYEPLRLLGFEPREEAPRVHPTGEERLTVQERVGGKPFILIHPGGRLPNKRWPLERFAELIHMLGEKTSHEIVLVCGPGEEPWACDLAASLPAGHGIFWPTPTLGELMGLAEKATLFVGNDSGPMHLAAASGCRGVAIFGTDPTRWSPAGKDHCILGGSGGMSTVSVEEVLKAVLERV